MPSIASNGIELYFERQGEGPPLLLVAGMASDLASWAPVIEPLAQHHDVIAFDNRCTGRTTPSPCPVTLDLMVGDCIALLDHIGTNQVHIIGHSLGGMIGLHLASRFPDRVSSLVTAATAPVADPMHLSLFEDLASVYETDGVAPELFFRLLFPWLFAPRFFADRRTVEVAAQMAADYPHRQSPAGFRQQISVLESGDMTPDLEKITCPVLVLAADDDLMFPADGMASAFAAIRTLSTTTIRDAGHSVHWDQPQAFVDSVRDFYAEIG